MAKTCQNCRITNHPAFTKPALHMKKAMGIPAANWNQDTAQLAWKTVRSLGKNGFEKVVVVSFRGFIGGGSWRDGVFLWKKKRYLKKNMPIFGSWRQAKKCVRFLSLSLKLLVLDIVLDLGQFDIILSDKFECFATAFGTFPKLLKHTFAPTFLWMFFFSKGFVYQYPTCWGDHLLQNGPTNLTKCSCMTPEAICWDSWHWRNTTNQHRSEVWSSPTSLPVTSWKLGVFANVTSRLRQSRKL